MALREMDLLLMDGDRTQRRLLAFRMQGLPPPTAPDAASRWRKSTAEVARADMGQRKGVWPVAGGVSVVLGIDLPRAAPDPSGLASLVGPVIEGLVEAGALGSTDQAEEVRLLVEKGAVENDWGLTVVVSQPRSEPSA